MDQNIKKHWEEYYSQTSLNLEGNVNVFSEFFTQNNQYFREAILDLGCGDGKILKILRDGGLLDIYGLDCSSSAIRISEQTLLEEKIQNNLIEGDMEQINYSFPNKKFNTLISNMSLQQGTFEYAGKLLNSWNGSLNIGGAVYILTRSRLILPNEYVELDSDTIFIPKLGITRVHFSAESLKSILPNNWRLKEFRELTYPGRRSQVSAFQVLAVKIS